MVNSPDRPGGCACILGPRHSVKVRAAEEYRQFKRPFLPPACAAVSALGSVHPLRAAPWLDAAGALHRGDQPLSRPPAAEDCSGGRRHTR